MVVLGGVIGATSGSLEGAGVLAGGGFISGLIGIVIAGPLSWVAGLIYALFINIALKAIWGAIIRNGICTYYFFKEPIWLRNKSALRLNG